MANRDKQYQIGKWPADISINFQSPLVLDSISMLRNQQIICPKCEKKKIYVWQYYDYLIYKCSNCKYSKQEVNIINETFKKKIIAQSKFTVESSIRQVASLLYHPEPVEREALKLLRKSGDYNSKGVAKAMKLAVKKTKPEVNSQFNKWMKLLEKISVEL